MSNYIFNGILGNNCGRVVPYNGSIKRLQEKGFTVEDGIPCLRGYAKISDLAAASYSKYEDYQREVKKNHVNDIANFLTNCKDEAKFLPEVVLSVNDSSKVSLKCYEHKALSSVEKAVTL